MVETGKTPETHELVSIEYAAEKHQRPCPQNKVDGIDVQGCPLTFTCVPLGVLMLLNILTQVLKRE